MSPIDPTTSQSPRSGRERRRHERAGGQWPVTIELEDGPHQARIRDISRGGLCFFLDRPLEEMTLLRVEFDLPEEDQPQGAVARTRRRLSGTGAVVRCERISVALDHYEIAVFLTEMADSDREEIEAYVSATGD